MKVSFVIVARSVSDCDAALNSINTLIFPENTFEILLATGSNPSLQRNKAVEAAKGDYIVFLDNDSTVDPRLLHYYFEALEYEDGIEVVGGPSVYRGEGSFFKMAVQSVFTSVFGLGPFRSRYMSIGQVRRTGEHELILCNMMVRRDLFLEVGGFNIDLYPNEENEFLNRIHKKTKIYYHPLAVCYRDPRENLFGLVHQMMSYGGGRARHLCMFPKFWDHIFLIPLAFCAYFGSMPWVLANVSMQARVVYALPMLVYALFNCSAAVFAAIGSKDLRLIVATPFLFFTSHICYGAGLIAGFIKYPFSSRKSPTEHVELFSLRKFSEKKWVKYG
jgi:glycosyltransferase involved in cell wall biosynthesis